MPVSLSHHQFAPSLPEIGPGARGISAASSGSNNGRQRRNRLGQRLAWAASKLFGTGRQAVINELSSLSDRELADIGLNRYDISRVFDPEFAREHSARG